jgi:glycine/D-amino acid oxidase-like deaminating enzyme
MNEPDTIVIGGGLVGLAIGYGLLRAGERILLLDEGDGAVRASRGNFGHVWVQGKGAANTKYSRWSMEAAQLWPAFAAGLEALTGVDPKLEQPGGLIFALSEHELETRAGTMQKISSELASQGVDYPFEILGANALKQLCPSVGPEVVGACFTPMDGQVNPLKMMRSLTAAVVALGCDLRPGHSVNKIEFHGGVFHVHAGGQVHSGGKLVLAAGLGNSALAPMVGLDAPVKPIRGQVLITERLEPFLNIVTGSVRQTDDGFVQIGESMEDVGMDDGTTTSELSRITARAIRMFPVLESVNIVRSWGALRIMAADAFPIYQASAEYPGAFLVTCHSGVTLAPQHAGAIVDWIRTGIASELVAEFKADRPGLLKGFKMERLRV